VRVVVRRGFRENKRFAIRNVKSRKRVKKSALSN